MRGSRLRKLVLFLAGWLAIIAFLGTANARYYLVCFAGLPNQQGLLPETDSCKTAPCQIQHDPWGHDVLLTTNENDCCRVFFQQRYLFPGDAWEQGGWLHRFTSRPGRLCFQRWQLVYGLIDAEGNFKPSTRSHIRTGPVASIHYHVAYGHGKKHETAVVSVVAGQTPGEKTYEVRIHFQKWAAPQQPAIGAAGGR